MRNMMGNDDCASRMLLTDKHQAWILVPILVHDIPLYDRTYFIALINTNDYR
jgi:hypothetical protein